MKFAIISIYTGKYEMYWDEFYKTAEKYFFKDVEKEYYIFTDSQRVLLDKQSNVHKFYQSKQPWPYDTLLRWNSICSIQDLIKDYDFCFFCNGNTIFLDYVEDYNLIKNHHLLTTFFTDKEKLPKDFILERNPKSKAYISQKNNPKDYLQGGFIGAPQEMFLEMSRELRDWTAEDLSNGIMPIWNDESMLNAYMLDKQYELWPQGMVFPEEWQHANKKVMFRDKGKHGGNEYLREIKISLLTKAKRNIKKMVKSFIRRK